MDLALSAVLILSKVSFLFLEMKWYMNKQEDLKVCMVSNDVKIPEFVLIFSTGLIVRCQMLIQITDWMKHKL